jgi:uncharacterized protein YkwD
LSGDPDSSDRRREQLLNVFRLWAAAILLGVASGVFAQVASYDGASGVLSIPAVKVGAATYVNVTLRNSGSYVFSLQAATEQLPPGAADASYDSASGVLTVPTVLVGGTTYINVSLRNVGGYTFTLLSATEQPPTGPLSAPVGPINTASRSEVVARWNDTYFDNTPFSWTGNVSGCIAGDTPTAFKLAVLRRLNYYRAMAGLPGNLALDLTFSAKAQQAALMMDAADSLSHAPATNWPCYSTEGAEAAGKSNLAYSSFPNRGVSMLDGYITDRGTNNFVAGHRRWILYSRLATVGTGDAPQTNALWVLGAGTTGAAAPKIGVPWPPLGYIPRPLQAPTDRFSYSCPGANFGNATIAMRGDIGQAIAARVESRSDNGYGDNTLVWSIDTGASPSSGWDRGVADTAVTIDIAGITNCAAGSTTSYSVTFITP